MVACAILSGGSLFMTQVSLLDTIPRYNSHQKADMVTSFVVMFEDPQNLEAWTPTAWQSYLVYLGHIIL